MYDKSSSILLIQSSKKNNFKLREKWCTKTSILFSFIKIQNTVFYKQFRNSFSDNFKPIEAKILSSLIEMPTVEGQAFSMDWYKRILV